LPFPSQGAFHGLSLTVVLTSTGYHISAGMAASMSQWMQHRNEAIFPDPMTFEPERWLSEAGKGIGGPEDYFIAFGRGSRVSGYDIRVV
jgi:cytochrome P450